MVRKETSPPFAPSAEATVVDARPPEVTDLLNKVEQHLQDGQSAVALECIARAKIKSPWLTNAAGVCQLRLGNTDVAVNVFRGLVLAPGGLVLRDDVPTVFKTNYATALLAAGHLSGGLSVLADIRDEGNPAVQRLRTAIRHWQGCLTFWQKVSWYVGGQPDRPLVLDSPLGDLQ
jgi:hypothetical protein